MRRGGGRRDQVVPAFWVVPAEHLKGRAIEGGAAPFALDDIYLVALAGHHEINLAALLVTPIAEGPVGKKRLQLAQS